MGNLNGVVSLICGIIAIIINIFFIPCILAIIFGLKGRKEDDTPVIALIGLILGIIALICSIIAMVLLVTLFSYALF